MWVWSASDIKGAKNTMGGRTNEAESLQETTESIRQLVSTDLLLIISDTSVKSTIRSRIYQQ